MLHSVSTSNFPSALGEYRKKTSMFLRASERTEIRGEGGSSEGHEPSKMTCRQRGTGAKIAHRIKVDMAALSVLFSVMEGAGIKMNISLQKHITPCSTLSTGRPTHWQRPRATEGNRSNQCESRDFFPPVTSNRLFNVTSAMPLTLPPSLDMRGTKPRKERGGVKEKIKTPSHS